LECNTLEMNADHRYTIGVDLGGPSFVMMQHN
jgi:hypothetical protein